MEQRLAPPSNTKVIIQDHKFTSNLFEIYCYCYAQCCHYTFLVEHVALYDGAVES